jgi:hypothetical protein
MSGGASGAVAAGKLRLGGVGQAIHEERRALNRAEYPGGRNRPAEPTGNRAVADGVNNRLAKHVGSDEICLTPTAGSPAGSVFPLPAAAIETRAVNYPTP